VQLSLAFTDETKPPSDAWEQLPPQLREAAIDLLARLIAQMAAAKMQAEPQDD
jgi:hypothetical protein